MRLQSPACSGEAARQCSPTRNVSRRLARHGSDSLPAALCQCSTTRRRDWARRNWSFRAASRTAVAVAGRRVRGGESLWRAGALQLHLHGPRASGQDLLTLGPLLSHGPPPAGGEFLAWALSRYLRKAGYPPAARTSLLFAPITTVGWPNGNNNNSRMAQQINNVLRISVNTNPTLRAEVNVWKL